jgi:hypothetical protein
MEEEGESHYTNASDKEPPTPGIRGEPRMDGGKQQSLHNFILPDRSIALKQKGA